MAVNTSCVFIDSSEFDPSWLQGGWKDAANGPAFVGGSAKVTDGTGILNFGSNGTVGGFAVSGFLPGVDKAQWKARANFSSLSYPIEPAFPILSTTAWWGLWMDTSTDNGPLSLFDLPIVSIAGMPAGAVVDFVTFFPPYTTSIKGKKIIVDNLDQLLVYTGSWVEEGGKSHENDMQFTVASGYPTAQYGVPYAGGVTRSAAVGDMVQFPFTGTSVSVYGAIDWGLIGDITVAFSIDGEDINTTTFPPALTPAMTTPNYNFFTSPALNEGDHILTIQIKEVVGQQVFMLDFIHYTASFDSLDSMPHIIVPPQTPTSSSVASTTPTPIPTKANVGTIAGGVVGGLLFLVIIATTLWLVYRRRRRAKQEALDKVSVDPFLDVLPESEKPISVQISGTLRPHDFTTMSWNAVTGATKVSSRSAKSSSSPPDVAPPRGAASSRDSAQRVRELEQQVQALVQQLQPPSYSDAGDGDERG